MNVFTSYILSTANAHSFSTRSLTLDSLCKFKVCSPVFAYSQLDSILGMFTALSSFDLPIHGKMSTLTQYVSQEDV